MKTVIPERTVYTCNKCDKEFDPAKGSVALPRVVVAVVDYAGVAGGGSSRVDLCLKCGSEFLEWLNKKEG